MSLNLKLGPITLKALEEYRDSRVELNRLLNVARGPLKDHTRELSQQLKDATERVTRKEETLACLVLIEAETQAIPGFDTAPITAAGRTACR